MCAQQHTDVLPAAVNENRSVSSSSELCSSSRPELELQLPWLRLTVRAHSNLSSEWRPPPCAWEEVSQQQP